MQQVAHSNERKEDLQTVKATIKTFLNDINQSLYLIKSSGYDTTELYPVFDLLRYEILTDKNISKLYLENKTDDLVRNLNTYSGIIKDLSKQLRDANKGVSEEEEKSKEYQRKIKDLAKPEYASKPRDIKEAICRLLLVLSAASGLFTGTFFYKAQKKGPATFEYNIGLDGKVEETNHHYPITDKDTVVEINEYEAPDTNGYAIKKVYYIDSGSSLIKDADSLSRLDLSVFEPSEITIEENVDLSKGYNRTYHSIRINRDEIVEYDEIDLITRGYGVVLSIIAGSLVFMGLSFIPGIVLIDNDYDPRDALQDLYIYLSELIKYKHELRKIYKNMEMSEADKAQYEKLVNTLCNRIDSVVVGVVDKLSDYEYIKMNKVKKDAEEKQQQHLEEKQEKSSDKEELFNSIKDLIRVLSEKVGEMESSEDEEKLLHSIPITREILFEKSGDHLVVKPMFIPLLPYLDLRLVSFDNVDIRYLVLTKTNASVNLRKIYNMDASFAVLSDKNVPDWLDYKGVTLTGTRLEENPLTMVNKDEAIVDKKVL